MIHDKPDICVWGGSPTWTSDYVCKSLCVCVCMYVCMYVCAMCQLYSLHFEYDIYMVYIIYLIYMMCGIYMDISYTYMDF
jgi:hypothetical protein